MLLKKTHRINAEGTIRQRSRSFQVRTLAVAVFRIGTTTENNFQIISRTLWGHENKIRPF